MKPLPLADLEHVRDHVAWEELRGARVFLTGATGFFGMWLLETFCHANDALNLEARATILTRDAAAFAKKAPYLAARADLDFHRGDVRNFDVPTGEFTHIVHGATTSSYPVAPREMYETVTSGTRRVLNFARETGARRMLLVSSGAVYGKQPLELSHTSENFRGAPDVLDMDSAYGQGKRAAEFECSLAASEGVLEVSIARGFAFVGPHLPLDAHFAAGNFLRDALRGDAIRVGGDGSPLRSYLYAADLAAWLWTILLRGQSARAYNVGSDEAVSIEQLATQCAALVSPPLPVQMARMPDANVLPSRYVPDISLARNELGLDVWISLDEALNRTFAWHNSTVEFDRT
ncbi:MAG TPA: NAD-dependent epimerase/dehydratase family protein [Abditibacteriaceae bacterium]|jgi:dTDP-glucose 4,6-dehydratase